MTDRLYEWIPQEHNPGRRTNCRLRPLQVPLPVRLMKEMQGAQMAEWKMMELVAIVLVGLSDLNVTDLRATRVVDVAGEHQL